MRARDAHAEPRSNAPACDHTGTGSTTSTSLAGFIPNTDTIQIGAGPDADTSIAEVGSMRPYTGACQPTPCSLPPNQPFERPRDTANSTRSPGDRSTLPAGGLHRPPGIEMPVDLHVVRAAADTRSATISRSPWSGQDVAAVLSGA